MSAPPLSSPPQQSQVLCPFCGAPGKLVKQVTLESLLTPEALVRAGSGIFRFCPNERCETVYFAESDRQIFFKSDLNVRVGIKETAAPRHVCYCFDHTVEEIDEEIRLTGKSTALDDIKTQMKEACWCETKNPQGSCCLSTVTRYVKAALEREAHPLGLPPGTNAEEDCCASKSLATVTASDHQKSSEKGWAREGECFSLFGSVISAVFASACCWLPLVLLAIGISGTAVGAVFERYRPILLSVTFGLLGAAFYFAYRPRPKVLENSIEDREDESCRATERDCCRAAMPRKSTLQSLNRPLLWAVTAIVLAFALFPNYVDLFLPDRAPGMTAAQDHLERVVVAVEGMTCKACGAVLENDLLAIPGVAAAQVSYESKRVTVHLRRRSPAPIANLLAKIRNAGYSGTVVDFGESH